MRSAFASFAVFAMVLLAGCTAGQQKKQVPDFSDVLNSELENLSLGDWNVTELDTGEIDAIFENMMMEKENVSVVYFYDQGCTACKTLALWLAPEKRKYNSSVIWFEYDIGTADGWEKYALFADSYNVSKSERYVPMVYIGGNHYWGIDGIRYNLTAAIDECHANGCYSPFEMLKE